MPLLETIEDAKEVIRSCRSIDRQYNNLKKNYKKPNFNNGPKNTIQKAKN